MPDAKQSLDESQQQCGHRHSRISHRGETNADFFKIISAHESRNAYCYAFHVDERKQDVSVTDMVLDVMGQYPDATK